MSVIPPAWFCAAMTMDELISAYPTVRDWWEANADGAEIDPFGSLAEAAAECGTTAEQLAVALAQAVELPLDERDEEWGEWAIDELIDHIVSVHHRFLRCELDRCWCLLRGLAAVDGTELVTEVCDAYLEYRDHMLIHIDHEEQRLFPGCRQLEIAPYRRAWSTDEFLTELRIMENGHDDTMLEIAGVQALVGTLQGVSHHPLVAAVHRCLDRITSDLKQHSIKEDDYLLPAITHAEELLDRRRESNRRRSESGDSDDYQPHEQTS